MTPLFCRLTMHYRLIIFCIALVFSESGFANTLFDSAVDLYKQQKHGDAFSIFLRLAENGDAAAQYNVAVMYERREYPTQSRYPPHLASSQQAFDWYQKSASQGFPPAQYVLGEMYYQGYPVHGR